MFNLILALLICGSLYFTVNCSSELEWIDPFKLESRQSKQLVCDTTNGGDVLAHYRRAVNLILSSVIVETSDPNTYKGRLFVDIPAEDYTFLKKFATIDLEEPLTLQKVDQILTKIFTKSTIDELSDVLIYWSDYIYLAFFNRTTGLYLIIMTIAIVIYKLLKASYTVYQVMIYLLSLGYMLDFLFTWKRMLQELEIDKYADSLKYDELPPDCRLSDTSGWKFLLSFVSSTSNCKEYHKILLYDVFWDVGPLDVITHQSRVFLGIASNIGIGLGRMTSGLMNELPFPWNIILLPILLVFILFIIWSIFTFMTDTRVDLNLFHLIYIKFTTNKAIKEKTGRKRKGNREELQEIEVPKIQRNKVDVKKKKKENLEDINSERETVKETSSTKQDKIVESIAT